MIKISQRVYNSYNPRLILVKAIIFLPEMFINFILFKITVLARSHVLFRSCFHMFWFFKASWLTVHAFHSVSNVVFLFSSDSIFTKVYKAIYKICFRCRIQICSFKIWVYAFIIHCYYLRRVNLYFFGYLHLGYPRLMFFVVTEENHNCC